MYPNITQLKTMDRLPKLLLYAIKVAKELILMDKIGSGVVRGNPKYSLSSIESAKLKTDGADRNVAEPSDNLVIFTVPLLQTIDILV